MVPIQKIIMQINVYLYLTLSFKVNKQLEEKTALCQCVEA